MKIGIGAIIFKTKKGIKTKILYRFKRTYTYIKNGFRFKTILFYPQDVYRLSMMNIIVYEKCYKTTNDPNEQFDLAISWDYDTYRRKHSILVNIQESKKVLNLNCLNIGKSYVSDVFYDVFGYNISVDPTQYKGKVVKKSELNALHDGEVIDCPIQDVDNNFNYTKLIDSTINENYTLDLRVLYFNGEIPFVYKRFKGLDNRFDAKNIESKVPKTIQVSLPQEVFSEEELNNIVIFCKRMKLDYGELDVLRDNGDNKIYIVDVNTTPSHQPYNFQRDQKKYAYRTAARIFDEQFF